ncbi:glucosaminidase domain-containing protein [Fundicoccus culcitae]|uniref:CHAP domain-containing protein n=1 Tax=Fundicoccus culcitae TaxID=2969821 RepID=A0ABY5P9M4_9LACT|nr:glucosaminidase domain-containing protein [Fundicoccus culcitae]UUX35055.1 CHAP domain-containing protein [Fundicoccus culcitae]
MVSARYLLAVAEKYLGVVQGSLVHRGLIDSYNRVTPRPMGYQMTYDDPWCDAFLTVVGDECGASQLIGRECGVQRHIYLFKEMGIWKGRTKAVVGDIVCFDWDGGGFADHIGLVAEVSGNRITTIEGNSNRCVAKNNFQWDDGRIVGYARPRYGQVINLVDVVEEVIRGLWGSGLERRQRLLEAGFNADAVQASVNAKLATSDKGLVCQGVSLSEATIQVIVSLAQAYQILPSFLIVMLHYESMWGNSEVGRLDNNWAGMTWSANYKGHPAVLKTPGLSRPVDEGGQYIHYQSSNDFLQDWVYLLRPNHSYKVADHVDFYQCIKGLFKVGGAKYDYAASGYQRYLQGMSNRKQAIEQANPGKLALIDQQISLRLTVEEIAKEVIQGKWFNGEARQKALTQAGYSYELVQGRVNQLLLG